MVYARNVPAWERFARIVLGLLLILGGFGLLKGWMAYALGASGAIIVLTGFVGFCPMCALAGRRLDDRLKGRE